MCIGSTRSFKGLPELAHNVAAQHDVIGLVKTLAIELASYNVIAECPKTVEITMINNQAFYEYFTGWTGKSANRENVIR